MNSTLQRSFLALVLCASLTASARAERSFEAWAQQYDTTSTALTQTGTASATDSRGNVAITGFIANETAWYTAKYDGNTGRLIWEDIFDGTGADRANDVTFDSAGNVIVTGSTTTSNGLDFFTIKYDGTTGDRIWTRLFDGPNNGSDESVKVVVDGADNVIIAGTSFGSDEDIQLIRYSAAGAVTGGFRYTSGSTRPDFPTDLAVDSAGFAIVTGTTTVGSGNADIYLAKINLGLLVQDDVWTRLISSAGTEDDDEGRGVSVDANDNVIVTGIRANPADKSHTFLTRKYTSAGGFVWERSFQAPVHDNLGPVDVGVDSAGNAFVTGTSTLDTFKTTFYTAKYAASNGAVLWQKRSSLPGAVANTFQNDRAVELAVDPSDNVIVTGIRQFEDGDTLLNDDYYTVKYAAADGALLWEQRRNGDNDTGEEAVASISVDKTGGVVVTGRSRRATGNTFQILTVKYGRFIVATRDPAPGAGVDGSGVPEGATIASVFTPAIGDDGTVAARVVLAKRRARLGAILVEGAGGTSLPAVQGASAPGVDAGKWRTFSDPIVAPNGSIAFTAKLSGVRPPEASGLWTNAFTSGALDNVLQTGKPISGVSGVTLKAIASISIRNGQVAALVKVSGPPPASTVLLGITAAGTTTLLRTDDPLTIGAAPASKIRSITVLAPPRASPGHGRWHGNTAIVARVTLADRRTAVLAIGTNGAIAQLLFTGQEADNVANGAAWKTFGFPAIGSNGTNVVALGVLALGEGDVTRGNDSAIVVSTTGAVFNDVARKGQTAPGTGNATYAAFFDPVTNAEGGVAFLAALGGNAPRNGRSAIFTGTFGGVTRLARTGETAPTADGTDGTAKYTAFTSLALPSGTGAGPVFLAKLTGSPRANTGLFAPGSDGVIRQLLRTGDLLGTQKISRLTLLEPVRSAFATSRSYNAAGSIVVLVGFTDRTQALLQVAIP